MTSIDMSWTPHPGEYIKEELDARGWSQRDLCYILGCSEQSINPIISGKRNISYEMAKALAEAFRISPEFFANLQKSYDLSRAHEPDPGVARRAKLQSIYPIREMIKRGWIEDTVPDMLEAQMIKFFNAKNLDEIPHLAHAAKKTDYEKIEPSQLAWLYRVKQIAQSINHVPEYSKKALENSLSLIKQFLIDPQDIRHVPQALKECGIILIFVECLPQAKIDGVCFWLDTTPVIGMSLRYDRIDNFWFVLRHEIEHVLQGHGKQSPIIDSELEGVNATYDSSVPEEERIANKAAAEFTVPSKELESFIARKQPFIAEKDVLGFAHRIQVHPGIVVGQIQNRIKKYDFLRRYLVKIRQYIDTSNIIDGWGYTISISL